MASATKRRLIRENVRRLPWGFARGHVIVVVSDFQNVKIDRTFLPIAKKPLAGIIGTGKPAVPQLLISHLLLA